MLLDWSFPEPVENSHWNPSWVGRCGGGPCSRSRQRIPEVHRRSSSAPEGRLILERSPRCQALSSPHGVMAATRRRSDAPAVSAGAGDPAQLREVGGARPPGIEAAGAVRSCAKGCSSAARQRDPLMIERRRPGLRPWLGLHPQPQIDNIDGSRRRAPKFGRVDQLPPNAVTSNKAVLNIDEGTAARPHHARPAEFVLPGTSAAEAIDLMSCAAAGGVQRFRPTYVACAGRSPMVGVGGSHLAVSPRAASMADRVEIVRLGLECSPRWRTVASAEHRCLTRDAAAGLFGGGQPWSGLVGDLARSRMGSAGQDRPSANDHPARLTPPKQDSRHPVSQRGGRRFAEIPPASSGGRG